MEEEDYIKRSDALKAIRYKNWREENRVPSIEELHLTEYQLLAEAINNIHAADVEPVRHGRWIEKKKNMTEGAAYMIPLIIKYFVCSLCGREEDIAEPYCNCGAKMEGGGVG